MSSPRLAIESLMRTQLARIGPANGDPVPQAIWQVITDELLISQVPDQFRPTIIVLSEEGSHEYVGLGGVQQTTLSVAILLYLTIASIDQSDEVCTHYADAVCRVLALNRDWGGLALVTNVTGVPTHQLLTVPDAIVTVFADVQYRHEDVAA